MPAAPRLEVRRVTKSFRQGRDDLPVLRDVSLEVEAGRFATLLGPSGSGKSTLLEIVAGLALPDRGDVLLDGVATEGAGVAGYMPQKDLLLPWRTLLGNITLGPEMNGRPRASAEAEARELLRRFGLHGFEESYPYELSGGMRQRGALLRTVMYQRRFLILDEPLSALDALTRLELQAWLGHLVADIGSTTLLVTHDIREALRLSDVVFVLSGRPAGVIHRLELAGRGPRDAAQMSTPEMARLEQQLMNVLLVPS
jgi:ABC-type nitrate/sulfonate/bicarbonate transport system ATPase subunit